MTTSKASGDPEPTSSPIFAAAAPAITWVIENGRSEAGGKTDRAAKGMNVRDAGAKEDAE